jgi:hypothetical protein
MIINTAGKLYQTSRLYQQLEPLLVTYQPRQEFGRDYPLAFTALYFPEEEPVLTHAYQLTEATIDQLRREVEADGAQFAVALISPWPLIQLQLLTPDEQALFLRDNPQFAQAQIDKPNRRLAGFLSRNSIPFFDLAPPMIAYASAHNRVPLYIVGEGHWTVEGNRVVANLLADWLRTEAFLEK